MQNLIVLMEPFTYAYEISFKAGNMCLNQFCIDEGAAFELSGIHYLKKSSFKIFFEEDFEDERKSKETEYKDLLPPKLKYLIV